MSGYLLLRVGSKISIYFSMLCVWFEKKQGSTSSSCHQREFAIWFEKTHGYLSIQYIQVGKKGVSTLRECIPAYEKTKEESSYSCIIEKSEYKVKRLGRWHRSIYS